MKEVSARRDVVVTIITMYIVGFLITWGSVGLGRASRNFLAEGLILLLWMVSAHWLLKDLPIKLVPVKYPQLELWLGLAGLVLLSIGLVGGYLDTPVLAIFGSAFLLPLVVFLLLRYN